jgi:ribonuclease inhibitor
MTKKNVKPESRKRGTRAVIPADVKSIGAVYDILARDLDLPHHFGRNLDALYDALTGDVAGPFVVVIEDAPRLKKALGAKGAALVGVFQDVARARRDATIMYGFGKRR